MPSRARTSDPGSLEITQLIEHHADLPGALPPLVSEALRLMQAQETAHT